jgi:mannitol/fructose-specific phosphotransferase system IIA component (Ntr-type)
MGGSTCRREHNVFLESTIENRQSKITRMPMLLTEILTPQRVKVPLASTDRDGAIAELVDLLAVQDKADRDRILTAVLDRERIRTTGIGGGIALPHGKCSAVKDLIMAMGKPAAPVDFQSVDGKPVSIIFLLVSPMDKTGPHIQALARISRLLSFDAVRNKLNTAATAEELFAAIKTEEESRG